MHINVQTSGKETIQMVNAAQIPISSDAVDSALIEKAADGDAYSQNLLGIMYMNGDGVEKNDSIAKYWFFKAAEQGFTPAQMVL